MDVVVCVVVVAFFAASSADDNNLNLYVEQLLTFFRNAEHDVTVHSNLPRDLRCPVVISPGDKDISIEWLHDGSLVENTTARWILPNGTLHLEALEPEMAEGTYECLVRHRVGTISSSRIHLRVPKKPEFVQNPRHAVAFQGESGRLSCVANGTPDPAIIWWKDGRPLSVNASRFEAFDGVLHIADLRDEDEGSYECQATNAAGEERSLAAELTVKSSVGEHVATKLLSGPHDRNALVFDRVVLECLLSGRPRPAVTWTKKDGSAFESHGEIRVTGLGNLEIKSARLSDSGVYVCSWTGADGYGLSSSAEARLSVLAPPHLLSEENLEWLIVRRRRQVVRLGCRFGGMPRPEIAWLRNGKVLEPNGRIRMDDDELIISPCDISDSGFYQCRGENGVGAAQSVMWVNIEINENAPLPPVDLNAVAQSSASILLTWNDHPLSRNRTIIAYSVHSFRTEDYSSLYQHEKKENQVVLKKMEESMSSQLTIDGLEPFMNYTFYVVSYSSEGGSDYSAFVTAVTHQDVPRDSPPTEITSLGADALRVRWSELSQSAARGIVLQYRVLHRLHGNSSYQQNVLDAELQEFIIRGLRPETEYDVGVVAATKMGFSDLDSVSWVTVKTDAVGKTEVSDCLAMNISLLNSSALLISWRYRNTSKPVSFQLTIQKAGRLLASDDNTFLKFIIDLDSGADKYIFTQIEVPVVYQVNLVYLRENGQTCGITKTFKIESLPNGDYKNSFNDPSRNNLPAPPTKISARAVNSSAIYVQWEKPATADPVARYTVRCRPEGSESTGVESDASVVKLITSRTEVIVIGGLAAYTLYDLSIQTHTDAAVGPFSAAVVKCRTDEGVPSEPLNVQLALYSSTAIEVSWTPPVRKNGVIQSYIIHYSDDSSKVLSEWKTKISAGSSLSSIVTHLASNTVFYFRLTAATFVGEGAPSDVVHIQTSETSGALELTNEPSIGAISDLDLGIIIGTVIGVTCIIICVIIIVVRDRRCAPSAVPLHQSTVANGAVKSCRCHLANCSGVEPSHEPWRGPEAVDEDDYPSANSVLMENENCDTKGGYTHGGKKVKVPLHVVANDLQATPQESRLRLSNLPNNKSSISLSVDNKKPDNGAENVTTDDDNVPEDVADKPTECLLVTQSPSLVASRPSENIADGESNDTAIGEQPDGYGKLEPEVESSEDSLPGNGTGELDATESLLGNSHRANSDHKKSDLHLGVTYKNQNIEGQEFGDKSGGVVSKI